MTKTCRHCHKRPRTTKTGYVNRAGLDRWYWSCQPCQDVFTKSLNAAAQVESDLHWNALVAQGLVVGLPTVSAPKAPTVSKVPAPSPRKLDPDTGRSPSSLTSNRGFAPLTDARGKICDTPLGIFFQTVLIPLVERLGRDNARSLCRSYGLLSKVVEPYEDPTVDALVQECRIVAWDKLDRFVGVPEDELLLFVQKFVSDVQVDYLRAEKVISRKDVGDGEHLKRPLRLDTDEEGSSGLLGAIAVSDPGMDPDMGSTRLDAVLDAVASVAGSEYLFLYYAGVPDEDVAKDKGVSLAAVRQNRSRAMKRARLATEGI